MPLETPPYATPSTGGNLDAGHYTDIDNRFYDRGQLCAVAVRDNLGSSTNLSPLTYGTPPTVNFTPFSADGNLRSDLFAWELVQGTWRWNHNANLGFWLCGALDERNGPDRKASVRHEDVMILQSNFPFDSDITSEGMTIQFTALEALKPFLVRLRMNLPLNGPTGSSIVEAPGTPLTMSKPVEATIVNRQLMMIFARSRPGGFVYTVEVYPLVKLTDIGAKKRSKTEADAASLTFTVLPDPFYVDLDQTNPLSGNLIPVMYTQYVAGAGWTSMAGGGSI